MRIAKYLGGLALAAILVFAFVVMFSSAESRFQCTGTLSSSGALAPASIYIKLAKYRWWVGFWSDSDAALWLEIPNATVEYFGHVVEVGEQLQIFRSGNKLAGQFSHLSKTLALSTPNGFFDGVCTKIDA